MHITVQYVLFNAPWKDFLSNYTLLKRISKYKLLVLVVVIFIWSEEILSIAVDLIDATSWLIYFATSCKVFEILTKHDQIRLFRIDFQNCMKFSKLWCIATLITFLTIISQNNVAITWSNNFIHNLLLLYQPSLYIIMINILNILNDLIYVITIFEHISNYSMKQIYHD